MTLKGILFKCVSTVLNQLKFYFFNPHSKIYTHHVLITDTESDQLYFIHVFRQIF